MATENEGSVSPITILYRDALLKRAKLIKACEEKTLRAFDILKRRNIDELFDTLMSDTDKFIEEIRRIEYSIEQYIQSIDDDERKAANRSVGLNEDYKGDRVRLRT